MKLELNEKEQDELYYILDIFLNHIDNEEANFLYENEIKLADKIMDIIK